MPSTTEQVVRVIELIESLDQEACSLLQEGLARVIEEGLGNRLDVVYALCSLLAVGLSSLDEPTRTMLREDIPVMISIAEAQRGRN